MASTDLVVGLSLVGVVAEETHCVVSGSGGGSGM